jgi:signal peptidase I
MTIPHLLLYAMIIIYFISFPKLFAKAGRTKTWEGYVPVYNLLIWLKILGKPWWWIFFFPIPFVNFVVTVALNVETGRLFGKYDVKSTVLSVLLPWYYIPYLAFKNENQLSIPTNWESKTDTEKRKLHDHIALFFISLGLGNVLVALLSFGSKPKPGKKSMAFEWTNALGFAIVAATIIRTFAFEAFTIPTGSMEKTMRIGDYLFVNKWKYGPRSPMTPMSLPFVHNRIPGSFAKSYVEIFPMDYYRLPGYGNMTRGDIMVFNWPIGDSVLLHEDVVAHDYYAFVRNQAYYNFVMKKGIKDDLEGFEKVKDKYTAQTRQLLIEGGGLTIMDSAGNMYNRLSGSDGVQTLVLDKKENYIKRCVAAGGDNLEIRDAVIYINGEKMDYPKEVQFQYRFYFKNPAQRFTAEFLDEQYEIYQQDINTSNLDPSAKFLDITCTPGVYTSLSKSALVDSSFMKIEPLQLHATYSKYSEFVEYCGIFPNHPSFNWSRDNFGPLHIPEKGWTVELTPENWILYHRPIEAYEGNTVEVSKEGAILINGQKATSYTFKQNYYWMMGDNRHGSVDSRYWGFVPEDHIVGTASFVWMSKHPEKGWFSGGLRWGRVFSFVE